MEIYCKILQFLADNDNGQFIDITHLVPNYDLLNEKTSELKKAGYLSVSSPGYYSFGDGKGNITTLGDVNLKKLEAKILLAGYEYLNLIGSKKTISTDEKTTLKKTLSKDLKLKYINELIYEVEGFREDEISVVKHFIKRCKTIIVTIESPTSKFIEENDIFKTENNNPFYLPVDWHEQIHNALLSLKFKIEIEEEDTVQQVFYIDKTRIEEIREINHSDFDLSKLIQLCIEINSAYSNKNYLTVGVLVRTIINHIPPIFSQPSFASVIANYKSEGNSRSFRETMEILENSSRKIGDSIGHSIARKKESLPNSTQIDFRQPLDVLLSEIVRILKPR